MSDTVKAALIIGICLMLGLWGNGWLSKSGVGRYILAGIEDFDGEQADCVFNTKTGRATRIENTWEWYKDSTDWPASLNREVIEKGMHGPFTEVPP